MSLPVTVNVVVPLPKPFKSMPLQKPGAQFAFMMWFPVTTPVNVATLPALAFPIEIPAEPLPALTQSVLTLFVIVLFVTLAVILLVLPLEKTVPDVRLTVQVSSVPTSVDELLAPIDTPFPLSLLNVHVPAPGPTSVVTLALLNVNKLKPSDAFGLAIVTLSTVLFVKFTVAVPVLIVMKTLCPKSLSWM